MHDRTRSKRGRTEWSQSELETDHAKRHRRKGKDRRSKTKEKPKTPKARRQPLPKKQTMGFIWEVSLVRSAKTFIKNPEGLTREEFLSKTVEGVRKTVKDSVRGSAWQFANKCFMQSVLSLLIATGRVRRCRKGRYLPVDPKITRHSFSDLVQPKNK